MTKVAWFDAEKWEKEHLQEMKHRLDVDFFSESLNEETVEKAEDYDTVAVFVDSNINKQVIDELDAELVACRSTGVDHVDTDYAAKNGLMVSNVPSYGSSTIAEHTFGLMLDLTRKISKAENAGEDVTRRELRGTDLQGKKLGVIGTGHIGERVVEIAKAFNMDVIAYDPYPRHELEHELGFMYVELEDLLKQSDIITLHCPLTDDNHHLLSEHEFDLMENVFLVNTARGELIDTDALVQALEEDSVKSAALDVVEEESRVKEREDIAVTPHNAFNSKEALQRILETTVDNIEGRENVVNTPWG